MVSFGGLPCFLQIGTSLLQCYNLLQAITQPFTFLVGHMTLRGQLCLSVAEFCYLQDRQSGMPTRQSRWEGQMRWPREQDGPSFTHSKQIVAISVTIIIRGRTKLPVLPLE